MTTPVADVNGDGTLAHASALQEAYDMLHLAPALQEAYDMLHLAPPDEPPRRRTLQEAYDLQVAEDVDSTAAESPCMGLKRSAAQLAVADDNGSGMLHLAPPDEPLRRRTLQEFLDIVSTAAESPCMGLKQSAAQRQLAVADDNGSGMLHLAPPDEPPRRRTLQESYDLQVAEAVDSTAAESPCKKQKRKKIAVGDDDEEEEVKDAALMIHVEKCLARLRKSISPATIANNMYATALEFLAAQLAAAANTKTDEVHSIVPMNQEEWRILCAKWLQHTMLILGLKPPNPAEGSNFWHVRAACTRETLKQAAELVIRVMKQGDVVFDENEDLAAAPNEPPRRRGQHEEMAMDAEPRPAKKHKLSLPDGVTLREFVLLAEPASLALGASATAELRKLCRRGGLPSQRHDRAKAEEGKCTCGCRAPRLLLDRKDIQASTAMSAIS